MCIRWTRKFERKKEHNKDLLPSVTMTKMKRKIV